MHVTSKVSFDLPSAAIPVLLPLCIALPCNSYVTACWDWLVEGLWPPFPPLQLTHPMALYSL